MMFFSVVSNVAISILSVVSSIGKISTVGIVCYCK